VNASVDIPLAEVIKALRQELTDAITAGADEDLRFALGPIDLEIQLEVSRSAEANAGVRFWVISVGGSGERASRSTHTLRLQLTPRPAGSNESVLLGAEAAERPE
jgi:Trypsin-co-occurring domain 2